MAIPMITMHTSNTPLSIAVSASVLSTGAIVIATPKNRLNTITAINPPPV